ncbi:cell division protein ZapA [Guyparkeria halophila]|uniref:Cell division protein ZapA n=1 Tax=Guyparkeria halophila TaxID=47960 RepID=A0ABZ0YXT4_9GAMM|nr:cell division protein ZapA [Guyparkeria halophila]WQH16978.1 cell division protein ZapA [Guyparkeria halophila]
MSQRNHPVTVRVMEKDYRIVCPPEEQGMLLRTAEYLNDEMAEIRKTSKVLSTERIAVLAALNITRQLLEGRELELPADLDNGELAGRIDRLLEAMEQS